MPFFQDSFPAVIIRIETARLHLWAPDEYIVVADVVPSGIVVERTHPALWIQAVATTVEDIAIDDHAGNGVIQTDGSMAAVQVDTNLGKAVVAIDGTVGRISVAAHDAHITGGARMLVKGQAAADDVIVLDDMIIPEQSANAIDGAAFDINELIMCNPIANAIDSDRGPREIGEQAVLDEMPRRDKSFPVSSVYPCG